MSGRRSFRRCVRTALVLTLLAAFAYAAPSLLRPPTASAQLSTCSDGNVVFAGQSCGTVGPSICPSGALVGAGQACSTTTNPFGTLPAACPGGGSPLPGQGCGAGAPTTVICPIGIIISVTQSCPGQRYITCPNGQSIGSGSTCPAAAPSTVCPNGLVILAGTQCPGSSVTTPPETSLAPAPGISVSYRTGWNLVAGPTGTVVTGPIGTLYTFQAGDTSYETVPAGTQLKGGAGYWAYFTANVVSTVPLASAGSATVQLPAGQFVMIGNSGDSTARVSGADIVLVFDPSANSYSQTTSLAAGQGAWAVSNNGGTATIISGP